jgi:hypothetical protein
MTWAWSYNHQSMKSMVESNSNMCMFIYVFFSRMYMNIPIGFLGLSNGWNTNTLWIASGNETCPSWDQNMRFEGSPLASASGGSCFGYFAYPMPYTILNY